MERFTLAPGYSVSRIINGGWQLSAGHWLKGTIDREAALGAMAEAVEAGFTTFDCADIYTGVEELIGELIRRRRAEGRPAGEIQVHTKLVPDRSDLPRVDRRYVTAIVDRSLQRLGVERLDLVQFHWWDYDVPGCSEAALALDELRAAGKVRLVGLTNFDTEHLRLILDAGVSVASIQVQYSLLDRRSEHGLLELCRRRGVGLFCYGSLAGGFISDRWLGKPAPSDPDNRSLVKYRLIIEELGGWEAFQELLRELAAIAARHGVSSSAVAIRWALDRPGVAGVIVGTRSSRHIAANRDVFALNLEEADRRDLDAWLQRHPGPPGEPFGLERVEGGPHASIMKTELNRE
ncbi:MAG: aldo/keto reductase [Spirochaetales bacterium]|nr:aldo/keto reductase [Spirochaetales bacterium]